MLSNRLAFAALAVACIGAAAGGGYVALRRNTPPVERVAGSLAAAWSEAPSAVPVEETEAVVDESGGSSPVPLAARPAAPATNTHGPVSKRADAAQRPA